MRQMASMELTDDEKLDTVAPIEIAKKPDFPWGLRISLTEAEFEKLKVDGNDAEVGGTFHGWFMARVTAKAVNEIDGKKCLRVEAQIEDLGLESEDEENED